MLLFPCKLNAHGVVDLKKAAKQCSLLVYDIQCIKCYHLFLNL